MRKGMPQQEAEVTSQQFDQPATAEPETPEVEVQQSAAQTGPELDPGNQNIFNQAAPSQAEFDELKAAYDQLKSERDQLVDRVARLQAEFENARKRAERERQDFRDFATGSVIEQFLPVLDNFELALKSSGSAEQLRSGVELIVKQMEDVLRQLQVIPVPTIGQEFDPRHHEALGSIERDDLPDQHIAEEIRRGYKIRERLLRPALVRVASNPKQTSE